MIDISTLSIQTICDIAEQAKVLLLMAERRTNRIVVDYVPSRQMIVLPREEPIDDPLEVFPTSATPVTFVLEDALFAGTMWLSLTCGHRTVITPFPCQGYDDLLAQINAGKFRRGIA